MPDKYEQVRILYRAGYSRNQISRELHVGHVYVQNVIRELDYEDREAHRKNRYLPYVVSYNVYIVDEDRYDYRHFVARFRKPRSAKKYAAQRAREHYNRTHRDESKHKVRFLPSTTSYTKLILQSS